MTDQQIRLSPPNGILLVLDPDSGVLPEAMDNLPVVAAPSSVVVETLVEFDGETVVHLASPNEVPTDGSVKLRWCGDLETTGRVGVLNVLNETLLEMPASEKASVAVWTNREAEPDLIYVTVV